MSNVHAKGCVYNNCTHCPNATETANTRQQSDHLQGSAVRHVKHRMCSVLCPFFLAAAMLTVHSPAAHAYAYLPSETNHSLVIGVSVHTGPKYSYEQEFRALKKTGATSVRFDAFWSAMERKKGMLRVPARFSRVVTSAYKQGLKIVLVLDYGNPIYQHAQKPTHPASISAFANYAAFVARSFKGKIFAYEIWNEWDGRAGHTKPGSAQSYLALLKAVYPKLRAIDSEALILGGSVTSTGIRDGYLRTLIRQGALQYMSGLALHPYTCAKPHAIEHWKQWLTNVENDLTSYSGHAVPLYLTEVGWSSASLAKCATNETTQAQYAFDIIMAVSKMTYVRGIWWYDLRNDGENPYDIQDGFGLLSHSGQPKPALTSFRRAIQQLDR